MRAHVPLFSIPLRSRKVPMRARFNRLFRKTRFWFSEARNAVHVKRHRFEPHLEALDDRVVPAGGGAAALTNYYWTGAVSNDGSNVNNWSTVANSPNPSPPNAAPGINSALYFSNNYGTPGNNSNKSAQLTGASYGSINTTSAYSATITDTQSAVTFSYGSSVLGGTISTGTATGNIW